MRAVSFRFIDPGTSLGGKQMCLMVSSDTPKIMEESFRFDAPYMDLAVRYSNGQLCTFRRKSPPQGGEG